MVDQQARMTTLSSPVNLQVKSIVSTTPLYRNKDFLTRKYTVEGLSARQIADVIGCGHSTINEALERYEISKEHRKSGWIEYGFKLVNGKRVAHVRERIVIEQVIKKKNHGWSNAKIADWLNTRKIASSSGQAKWYPATIGRLIRLWTKD